LTNIDKLVAVEQQHGVSLDFLGHLIWFTVTDCRITRDTLAGIFDESGIDQKFLPRPISPRDAFRRATSSGEVKKVPFTDETFLNIMVRDVTQGKNLIERQIVREVVDGKNTRLEYKPVGRMVLKDTDIHYIPIEPMNAEERAAVERIKTAYEIEQDNYNGRAMRDIINDVLRGCKPVNVRPSGGVYFVPKEFEGTLENLQTFANKISAFSVTKGKSRVYRVPVVNAEEQLQMLEESLEDQVKKSSETLIAEMTRILLEDKTVTQRLAVQYVDQAKGLRELVESYRDMLQTGILGAEADLEVVLAQAMELLNRVDDNVA
jgi:predicted DNA-binding protein (UPF0278 family)